MIVVDASVLAPALGDDGPSGDAARARLSGESLAAPELIDLEVASVVRRQFLAGLLPERRAVFALRDLADLPLRRHPNRHLVARCWELRHNLSTYDAAYVAVAERYDAVLVTADEGMTHAPGIRCEVDLVSA